MKEVSNSDNQEGFIALIFVLIVSAAALAISLSLLSSGTDAQRSLLVTQQSAQARSLANACAEEALQQVHDNNAFTGSNSLNLSTGTCSYTVTNTGGNNRTIDASATIAGATRKVKVLANTQGTNINIMSWQDVT
ncbi:MAG TPA: hypothetical protein VLE51_02190 [Candidatus Saccharimonadales bacterium]|nr:hypothetical protein [Candidatus Saccharimonadales bacterium]